MFFVVFCIALAAVVLSNIYDVVLTERGIKAGVAVEGFTWLVGQKPTAVALYLRDSIFNALFAALPLVFYKVNPAVAYGSITGLVVITIKHVLGGRAWANLLAGGKPADPTKPLSAWQKFLGF